MNERMEELVKQANGQTGNEFDLNYKPLDTFLSTFAELIVQECVNVVHSRYMGDNNREDMEVRRCVEALQKHWN